MKSNYFLSFISLLSYASIICMDKAPQIKDYDPSVVISAIEASFQGSLVISDSEVLFEHYHTKNTIKLSGGCCKIYATRSGELATFLTPFIKTNAWFLSKPINSRSGSKFKFTKTTNSFSNP
jgi:hypothetical protein